jgi:hypothetical protein
MRRAKEKERGKKKTTTNNDVCLKSFFNKKVKSFLKKERKPFWLWLSFKITPI